MRGAHVGFSRTLPTGPVEARRYTDREPKARCRNNDTRILTYCFWKTKLLTKRVAYIAGIQLRNMNLRAVPYWKSDEETVHGNPLQKHA